MKCPNCEVEFEPEWFGQLYCCKRCSRKAKEKRGRLRYGSAYKKRVTDKRISLAKDFIYVDKILKGCSRCPERRPNALEYHHVDSSTKTATISAMCYRKTSLPRLKREIEKCVLLCSNCHQVEEHGDGYRPGDKPSVG